MMILKIFFPFFCSWDSIWDEGTGTRPDYLVNRADKKIEGPFGKKLARKSRNSCRVNCRGCGCMRTVDSGPKCAQSWNQIQTLKECLCCHNYCAQFEPRWAILVLASRAVSNSESRYPSWDIQWREQEIVQNRFVSKLFRTFTTFPLQGT